MPSSAPPTTGRNDGVLTRMRSRVPNSSANGDVRHALDLIELSFPAACQSGLVRRVLREVDVAQAVKQLVTDRLGIDKECVDPPGVNRDEPVSVIAQQLLPAAERHAVVEPAWV